jgi:hypothetical protein
VRALAAIALDARVCLHGFYSSRLCSLLCINPSWGTSAGGPQGAPPPKRYATNNTCRGDFMPEYARMNGVVRVAVCARLPLPFARLRQGPRIVQRIELVDRMLAYVSFTAPNRPKAVSDTGDCGTTVPGDQAVPKMQPSLPHCGRANAACTHASTVSHGIRRDSVKAARWHAPCEG